MKAMYYILIGASFIWTFISLYALVALSIELIPNHDPNPLNGSDIAKNKMLGSMIFAFSGGIYEIFAMFVALLGFQKNTKISMVLLISSVLMLMWSGIVYLRPNHISVDEVIFFWWIYVIAVIVLSAIGIRQINKKEGETLEDDGILDSNF